MALTVKEIINLGDGFDSKDVRLCIIDDVKHVSIVDVIDAVAGCKGSTSKVIWKRMKEEWPDVVNGYRSFRFAGNPKDTPVADAQLILRIIYKLPGKHAARFCEASAAAFVQILDPTPEFINDLEVRMDTLSKEDRPDNFLLPVVERSVRSYTDGCFYVRLQLPGEHIMTTLVVTNPKKLTEYIIKFGITYSMNERHAKYMADPDNGYMAFRFECCSRYEAEIIESIVKFELRDLTVLDSKEYLDAIRLAEKLGVEYDGKSYEQYVNVGRALFGYMVERLKLTFPGKYDNMYGYTYGIVSVTGEADQPKLTFPAQVITTSMAAKFGFRSPVISWSVPEVKPEPAIQDSEDASDIAGTSAGAGPSMLERKMDRAAANQAKSRSNGMIIGIDLFDGTEKTYGSVEEAARDIDFTPKALKGLVDTPRQMAGKVWRSPDQPFWVPPKGLHIDVALRAIPIHYVRGIDGDGNVSVYENPTIAAKHMGLIAREITASANTQKPSKGVTWGWVKDDELKVTSTDAKELTGRVTSITLAQDDGVDGRCRGKIVERDILTGEEVVHSSASKAAFANALPKAEGCITDLTPKMVKDELLDKCRPANGKTFRSFSATQRWQPPSYYKRDVRFTTENWPNKTKTNGQPPWIVATSEDGTILGLYETKLAASRIEGTPYDTIKTLFGTGRPDKRGRIWRAATTHEYGDFVPCSPPGEDPE